MRYRTRILPIDRDGGFLVATFHQPPIYRPRDVEHARFALGRADRPEELEDVTPLFTAPLPVDPADAERLEQWAAESEAAAGRKEERAHRSEHLKGVQEARLGARLARAEGRRIPCELLAARNGVLVAALGAADHPQGTLLRLVDLQGRVVRADIAPSAKTPLRLDSPIALSLDGGTILFDGFGKKGPQVHEHAADAGLKRRSAIDGDFAGAYPFDGGWLLANDDELVLVAHSGRSVRSIPLPAGGLPWCGCVTPDGRRAAFATDRLAVWVIDVDGGEARSFRPHRGMSRGAELSVTISDSGRWMATRANGFVAVTDLESGESWPAGRFPDYAIPRLLGGFDFGCTVSETIAFIGERLLASSRGTVRSLELEAGREDRSYVSEQGRPGARDPVVVPGKAAFEDLLEAAQLHEAQAAIRPHFSAGLRIETKPLAKNGWLMPGAPKAPALGTSRFGGWPDLPPGTPWPEWQGRPLGFIGQIDLTEAHAAGVSLRLPKSGLLSFFLGSEEEPLEDARGSERFAFKYAYRDQVFEEADLRNAWRVLFMPHGTPLERLVYPGSPLPPRAEPRALRFSKGALPLPDEKAAAYHALRLTGDARERYDELIDGLSPEHGYLDAPVSQLMGYPVRYPMFPDPNSEIECECARLGLDPAQYGPAHPRAAEIQRGAVRWGLLLQVATDFGAGFDWGGRDLYFYGERAAMEAGDFSRIWLTY